MHFSDERIEMFRELNKVKNEKMWSEEGFQVIVSAYNPGKWIDGFLDSVETSMRDCDWVMIFGNDGSEQEDVVKIAEKHSKVTSAKKYEIHSFEKARNVSKAKNRLIDLSKKYRKKYPALLFADADDIMCDGRPKLINTALEHNSNFIVGNWKYVNTWNGALQEASATDSITKLTFGPWATLIHESLVPDDKPFWNEDVEAHGDLLMWYELIAAGVEMIPDDHNHVASYLSKKGGVSKDEDLETKKRAWIEFSRRKKDIMDKHFKKHLRGVNT